MRELWQQRKLHALLIARPPQGISDASHSRQATGHPGGNRHSQITKGSEEFFPSWPKSMNFLLTLLSQPYTFPSMQDAELDSPMAASSPINSTLLAAEGAQAQSQAQQHSEPEVAPAGLPKPPPKTLLKSTWLPLGWPFMFQPNGRYEDAGVQAWADYYSQGGTHPEGAMYFISVPGIEIPPLPSRSPPASPKVVLKLCSCCGKNSPPYWICIDSSCGTCHHPSACWLMRLTDFTLYSFKDLDLC